MTHAMEMTGLLSLWVVYDHPLDWPNHYVARPQTIYPDGTITYGAEVLASGDLERLRSALRGMGKHPLPRYPEDDPVIVESWI